MIPTTGKNFKKLHELRVTCPGWFSIKLHNEAFFPLSNRCYDHYKNVFLPIFIAKVVRKTYSFTKNMQLISPNYNWENGVKQIKIAYKNLSRSCILCQLLRTKIQASGSKCIEHFFYIYIYHYLPYICWVHVIYLTCLVFLKSPWWLVWTICVPITLT